MRATIELYDSVQAGKGSYFRHNATLYTPRGGAPSAEETIRAFVTDALETVKESGLRYWHNSVRLARILVVRSSIEEAPMRLFPTLRTVPTSRFLWRIFLLPEEGAFELTGYKVEYKQKLLHRLTPLAAEDTKPKAEQET